MLGPFPLFERNFWVVVGSFCSISSVIPRDFCFYLLSLALSMLPSCNAENMLVNCQVLYVLKFFFVLLASSCYVLPSFNSLSFVKSAFSLRIFARCGYRMHIIVLSEYCCWLGIDAIEILVRSLTYIRALALKFAFLCFITSEFDWRTDPVFQLCFWFVKIYDVHCCCVTCLSFIVIVVEVTELR